MPLTGWLEKFVTESNKIEGIFRPPSDAEIGIHEHVLGIKEVTIQDLIEFVRVVAPGHKIRDRAGLDVFVGDHTPPSGSPEILVYLTSLLEQVNRGDDPYRTHRGYELLHPFTDGNGRSGRALWLWSMQKTGRLPWVKEIGFLHNWYYQSLADAT